MKRDGFYSLPEQQQVERLAGLASNALADYGMEKAEVELLASRENTTFAINAASGERFALRVHQAGYRSDIEIQSELDYMNYLKQEGIACPEVIPGLTGESFVIVEHPDVPEPRQCDLFEWIDGAPLRRSAEVPAIGVEEATNSYIEVGRLSAAIYNASERWSLPAQFQRPTWDENTIFGTSAHLGNCHETKQASSDQYRLMQQVADKVYETLVEFGKSSDRFGLSQCDLLAENIMVGGNVLRIIDFDDAGYGWVMFDLATALFDLEGSEYFDPCLNAFVSGFRELKPLPDEHVALYPTFRMARLLSYIGHTVSRTHLEQSEPLQQYLLQLLESYSQDYLDQL